MSHLEKFSKVFLPSRVQVLEGELRYHIKRTYAGMVYEMVAIMTIKKMGLPLVAMLDRWWSGGELRAVELVIRPVPDSDMIERAFPEHSEDCGDQVPDLEECKSELEFE